MQTVDCSAGLHWDVLKRGGKGAQRKKRGKREERERKNERVELHLVPAAAERNDKNT